MNRFLLYLRRYKSYLPVLLLTGALIECKCEKDVDPSRLSSSVNVALNQSLTDQQIKDEIRKGTKIPADSIKIKRCSCDSSLINIKLPKDWQFEGHDGEVATRPKNKGEGGGRDIDLDGLVAINQRISPLEESQFLTGRNTQDGVNRDSTDTKYLPPVENAGGSEAEAIRIAVFDSGLNPNYVRNTGWQQSTTLCAGNPTDPPASSLRGWNFMSSPATPLTADNQKVKHGSRVAYLLAQQLSGSAVPYRIIPMKVLGEDNTGDLFSILCAMETARKNDIHIFNMSLGYYGDRDTVFFKYIKRAVDQGIWIVTAAGNQPDTTQKRDLSVKKPSFYPAYFSKEFDRVIAVTTMSGGAVCGGQNFDQNFVVGVKDDLSCRFRLLPPGSPRNLGIIGTSYATPIVAGWLGRTMKEDRLMGLGVKRQQFVDKMTVSSPMVPGLFQGRFIQRK